MTAGVLSLSGPTAANVAAAITTARELTSAGRGHRVRDHAVQVRGRGDHDDLGALRRQHLLPERVDVRHAVGRGDLAGRRLVTLADGDDARAGGLEGRHVGAAEAEPDDGDGRRGGARPAGDGAHDSNHAATPPSTTTSIAGTRPP